MDGSRRPVVVFVVSEALALLGNAAFLVVVPWLLLRTLGSAAQVSSVLAVVMLPVAGITLLAGRLIGRVGARRFSVAAGLLAGAATAAMAVLWTDPATPAVALLGTAAVAQLCLPTSTTARDALMGPIADAGGSTLERLAGTRQLVFALCYAGGPALAGMLLQQLGATPLLGAIAVAWTAAALLTQALPTIPVNPSSIGQEDRTQTRPRWMGRPVLAAAVAIGFLASVITQPMTSVILPAHFQGLGQPQSYGLAVAAFALGALLGAIGYTALGRRAHQAGFIAATLIATAGMVTFALLPGLAYLAGGLALGGFGSGYLAPALMVAITRHTSTTERPRVLAVYNAASLGAGPIGLGLLGLLLTRTGDDLHTGAMATAAVWALAATIALIASRALTRVPAPQEV